MAKIGFLGLGAMGLPMAKRLCAAGHELKVCVHRNPAPALELERLGARVADGPAQVAAGVDYVVSILPEDEQIVEVLLNGNVVASVGPGTVIIEMSSAGPGTVRRLAEAYAPRGVSVLDAPVSGGVSGAVEGSLTIMCGGGKEVLEKARPVLEALGGKIWLVGGLGAGKSLKAVNNMLNAANTVLVAEALRLIRQQGLDEETAYQVIKASSGQSCSFDNRFRRMAGENFAGGFKLRLMMKDLRIALAEAGELPMPMSSLALQLYRMTGHESEDLDFSVVSRIFQDK